MRTASASISCPPVTTVCGAASTPVPSMTLTPSAASRPATSADWARARDRIRAFSRWASTAAPGPTWMPSAAELSRAAIRAELAIRVLEGTQSVRTHAPPRPSRSITVTAAPSCAATRAASYPPGPPPIMTIFACGWLTMLHCVVPGEVTGPRRAGRLRTLGNRGDLRGLWQQHEPGADGGALPALAAARHRLARGLAADLRRRGPELGRRPRHGRR